MNKQTIELDDVLKIIDDFQIRVRDHEHDGGTKEYCLYGINSRVNEVKRELKRLANQTPNADDTWKDTKPKDTNNNVCKCGEEMKYHKDIFPNLKYFALNCNKFEPKEVGA